jgi:hypothetical protein
MGMTYVKKNMLLLACLLMIVWLIVGVFASAGHPLDKPEARGEAPSATSSMNANGGFDLMEAGSALRISQMGQEPFRLQHSRSGIIFTVASAALLTIVLICLKLFQAVYLSFNFNRTAVYIHDQDGMK